MALNFLGLGFSFGYRDKGFTKGVEGAQKGLINLESVFNKLKGSASLAGNILGKSLRMPSIGPAAGAMQGIAGDMKVTTTNLEAFGVAADKVTRKAFAGLNLTADESKRARREVSGLAYGMNKDVGELATTFAAMKKAGFQPKDLGFASFKEMAKYFDVMDVNAEQFMATMARLRHQFQMAPEDIKDVLETNAQLAKHFNLGADAVRGMSDMIEVLGQEGATLWAELGPKKTKQFLKGTELLAAAFVKADMSAADAVRMAQNVGQTLIKSRVDMQKMFSGIESEAPEAFTVLTQHLNDAGLSWEQLQEDPMAFMKTMRDVTKKIRDEDARLGVSAEETQAKLARFSNQFAGIFDPETIALMMGGNEKVVNALDAVDAEARKLGDPRGSMAKMAKEYRSGLTAAELFARAQDQFRTALKKFKGETDSDFLNRYNKSAKKMLAIIKPMSEDTGILGKATRMMVDFSYNGIGGVVSRLHPLGPALFSMVQQFGPIISMMPGLTAAFAALASPITLVAAAIGLLYLYTKDKQGTGQFAKMVDNLAKKIPAIAAKIANVIKEVFPQVLAVVRSMGGKILAWVQGLPWKDIGQSLGDLLLKAAGALLSLAKPIGKILVAVLEGAFKALKGVNWSAVGEALLEVGKQLFIWLGKGLIAAAKGFQWLTAALAGLDWNKVASFLGEAAKMLFGLVMKVAWEILKGLPNLFVAALKLGWALITGAWNAIMGGIEARLGPFAALVKAIIYAITAQAAVMFATWAMGWVVVKVKTLYALATMAAGATVAWAKILGPIGLLVAAIYGLIKVIQVVKDKSGQAGAIITGVALAGILQWGKFRSFLWAMITGSLAKFKLLAGGASAASTVAQTAFSKSASKITANSLVSIGDLTSETTKTVSAAAKTGTSALGRMAGALGGMHPVIGGIALGATLIIANWDKIAGAWGRLWGKQKLEVEKAAENIKKTLKGVANDAIKTAQDTQDAIDKIGKIDIGKNRAKFEQAFKDYDVIRKKRDEAKKAHQEALMAASGMGKMERGTVGEFEIKKTKKRLDEAEKALKSANKTFANELGVSGDILRHTLGDAIEYTERKFTDAAESDIGWLQAKNEATRQSAAEQFLQIEAQKELGHLQGQTYVDARKQVFDYIAGQNHELTKLEQMSKHYATYGQNIHWLAKNQEIVQRIEQEKMLAAHSTYLNRLTGEERKKAEEYAAIEQKKYGDAIGALYTSLQQGEIDQAKFYTRLGELRDQYTDSTKSELGKTFAEAFKTNDLIQFFTDKILGYQEALRAKEEEAQEAARKAEETAQRAAQEKEIADLEAAGKKKVAAAKRNALEIKDVVASIDYGEADLFKRLLDVDPKKFAKDTENLKTAYRNFVLGLEKESKGLIDNARTNFKNFLAEQEPFWKRMGEFVSTFKTEVEQLERNVLLHVIGVVDVVASNVVDRFRLMFGDLQTVIQDAQAQMGGSADGGAAAGAQPDNLKDQLVMAIDHPRWYSDYRNAEEKRHVELMRRIDALIVVSAAQGTGASQEKVQSLVKAASADANVGPVVANPEMARPGG